MDFALSIYKNYYHIRKWNRALSHFWRKTYRKKSTV